MGYQKIQVPASGDKITVNADLSLNVPDNPIIPFIEGDGIGYDISPVMIKVVDAAIEKAYAGKRKISWMEVYAGEKATQVYDQDTWLPAETLDAIKEYVVSIKGPLTTPVGGGIRSLNVALRQELDEEEMLDQVMPTIDSIPYELMGDELHLDDGDGGTEVWTRVQATAVVSVNWADIKAGHPER